MTNENNYHSDIDNIVRILDLRASISRLDFGEATTIGNISDHQIDRGPPDYRSRAYFIREI